MMSISAATAAAAAAEAQPGGVGPRLREDLLIGISSHEATQYKMTENRQVVKELL